MNIEAEPMAKDRYLRKSCFTDALILESDRSLLSHKDMKQRASGRLGLVVVVYCSCRLDVGTGNNYAGLVRLADLLF